MKKKNNKKNKKKTPWLLILLILVFVVGIVEAVTKTPNTEEKPTETVKEKLIMAPRNEEELANALREAYPDETIEIIPCDSFRLSDEVVAFRNNYIVVYELDGSPSIYVAFDGEDTTENRAYFQKDIMNISNSVIPKDYVQDLRMDGYKDLYEEHTYYCHFRDRGPFD